MGYTMEQKKTIKILVQPESSVITDILYSGQAGLDGKGTMVVCFTNGARYEYPNVHLAQVHAFMDSDSVGYEFSIFKKTSAGQKFRQLV
jgi:hypothetical protein